MPSIKDLKKRITSVKNTQQTTRAMKLVSAAKLRRAQEAIVSQRPYARQIGRLIQMLAQNEAAKNGAPLLRVEPISTENRPNVLIISISSDRGLCGSFNANIVKATQRWINQNQPKYASIELITVGRRVSEMFRGKSSGYKLIHNEEFGNKIQIGKAKALAVQATKAFLSGRVDEVHFIYNEFKNAISQKIVVEKLLPVLNVETMATGSNESPSDYLIKPDAASVLEALLEKHFVTQAFRMLLESQASEHGARMSAMENATKNAGEMIKKLTLQYNKQRQAGITKELLEIIAGSESQSAEA